MGAAVMSERETPQGAHTGGQGATHKRLAAVVVTYNRLAQLQVTLARLLSAPACELAHIVVIDNASDDGTGAWLSTQNDPRLLIVSEPENRGGAGGFDRGMRLAVEQFDPDWLMVMDDDARPEPRALARFHDLDLTGWDGLAAAVYFPSGEICEMNRPSRNPFWHGREFLRTIRQGRGGFHLAPSTYEGAAPVEIDVTSFVGFFISRAGIERVGYPDPGLFIYGDDGLYTLDLSAKGGRICFEPRVRFEHDLSTFTGQQRGRFRPLWKVYYYHRNLLMLYRLAAGWLFWPALLLILPKWLMKARQHPDERRVFLALIGRAIRDGILRRRNVPHARVLKWSQNR